MDSGQTKNTNSQFISFHDFPSMSHASNLEGQMNTGTSTHQPFNNLSNDSTGIGMMEDLQGIPDKTDGIYNYILEKSLFNFISINKFRFNLYGTQTKSYFFYSCCSTQLLESRILSKILQRQYKRCLGKT